MVDHTVVGSRISDDLIIDMALLEARDSVQNHSFWRMLTLHSAMHS